MATIEVVLGNITGQNEPHRHLQRLALVHGPVAVRNFLKTDRTVEDPTGLDRSVENA